MCKCNASRSIVCASVVMIVVSYLFMTTRHYKPITAAVTPFANYIHEAFPPPVSMLGGGPTYVPGLTINRVSQSSHKTPK